MKKVITFFAVLAALTSAAFAGYVPEGYEQVYPDFDVDWSGDFDWFDYSYFESNDDGNGELGVSVTPWVYNHIDKSGLVTGEKWLFNANSDYSIYFKIDDITYDNIRARGEIHLYLCGYPSDDPEELYEGSVFEDEDDELRDGIFGEYRVSYGKDNAWTAEAYAANITDFVENGVVISFADILQQGLDYGATEGVGWHAGMRQQYPDGNYWITAVRVEVYSQTDWDTGTYIPGTSKAIEYLPADHTYPVELRLVRKIPQTEVPEPATYAYGLMGLASVFGLKRRIKK
ncbi:MAG: PEP-CTERM sorting domain-containing protein [Abditibacteriota bacterium]|nr:PEP-CTERM sorting domain-containing protein [Abditibacteriota bacterium]